MAWKQALAMKKLLIHSFKMTKLKKFTRYFLVILTLLITCSAITLHAKTYRASLKAQAIAQKASNDKDYLLFKPKQQAKANILFYQGALVEEESYAIVARDLADRGYNVYLLKTPLNLPIFGKTKALELIEKKHLKHVYLAGHSLGGVIASSNASAAKNIDGLILLASYPQNKDDLSQKDLAVLSITASKDKVLKWKHYDRAKKWLPKKTKYESIQGGNHSGFGSYGLQAGDGKATITLSAQEKQVVKHIHTFINAN